MQLKIKLPKIKISLVSVRRALLIILTIGLSFGAGYLIGNRRFQLSNGKPQVTITRELPADHQDLDFSLFWRVWDTLEAEYFDKTKLDQAQMVYGAIQGMVAALGDPYTVFLPPEENKVVQEDLQGNFEGVGIQIGFKGNQLAVIAPLPGTPAEKAGVQAGDFIIGIKDEQKGVDQGTAGITLPEAVQIIRGPAGSKVTLALLREGETDPLLVDIVRENINVPSVLLSFVGENEDIAQVRLLKFGGETNGEWEAIVREILKNPQTKGIVLDLRNNPGGYLQGAVEIAAEFVPTGENIVTQEDAQGRRQEFKTDRLGRLTKLPLVVLINQGSASASEILAGALRDINQTQIIGQTSFGKGTIQEPQQINGGSGLHITVARWLTPANHWLDEEGLTPDIEVKDDPETPEDEQLQKGIDFLSS